jgi:hypothetical protein
LNTIYSFKNNSFIGNQPRYAREHLSLIPNTPDFS